uniref:Uncharacterized protein n=1 Tax=Arundo donax TaxID=35708 RepID=A0A0A9CVU7_ARUDO
MTQPPLRISHERRKNIQLLSFRRLPTSADFGMASSVFTVAVETFSEATVYSISGLSSSPLVSSSWTARAKVAEIRAIRSSAALASTGFWGSASAHCSFSCCLLSSIAFSRCS